MKAIGVIEIKTISKGYLVSDGILDLVSVEIVMAQPVCPGKFVLILAGGVAEVENAVAFANRKYSEAVVDSTVLGRIEEEVYLSLVGAAETAQRGAVGIIETFSIAAVIQAADTAVKTSGVEIMEIRIARGMGGKCYALFTGSVSNVEDAVKNGGAQATEEGLLVDTAVIASPHTELWQYIE